MFSGVADTHATVWYVYGDSRLSPAAKAFIEEASEIHKPIGLATISLVEIAYLEEKGSVSSGTLDRVTGALARGNGVLVEVPLDVSVVRAMLRVARREVPDMPDRIIAATAVHLGVPLISRDACIRVSAVQTIW